MKISKRFNNYVLERTNKIIQFKNSIKKEIPLKESKKYSLLFQSIESIIKEYIKQNELAVEILESLVELEKLLEEIRYE